jgi:nucleotide-binding universal stress UspA family protein
MALYNRILVPLEGTAQTDEPILQHVAKLAALEGSEVVLLRVAHAHTRDGMAYELDDSRLDLERAAQRLRDCGFPVRTLTVTGEPAEVIIAQAEEVGADLIAMATHGHGWVSRKVYGSVAEKVRHESPVPLLLVRGSSAGGHQPLPDATNRNNTGGGID